jgi:hypothetical protein
MDTVGEFVALLPRQGQPREPGDSGLQGTAQIGPGVAKLSPGAIWGLSRKRCSGAVGRRGETPRFPGHDASNFPEKARTRESSDPVLVDELVDTTAGRRVNYAQMAPGGSFATPGPHWVGIPANSAASSMPGHSGDTTRPSIRGRETPPPGPCVRAGRRAGSSQGDLAPVPVAAIGPLIERGHPDRLHRLVAWPRHPGSTTSVIRGTG